jgi:hypothetical protein
MLRTVATHVVIATPNVSGVDSHNLSIVRRAEGRKIPARWTLDSQGTALALQAAN